jgi:hypothetical protein
MPSTTPFLSISRCTSCWTTRPRTRLQRSTRLLRHPRFTFHFTPTSSSWLNLVERRFAELTRRLWQRSAHPTVAALTADLDNWIATGNDDPRQFVWYKTDDQILDRVKKYLTNR